MEGSLRTWLRLGLAVLASWFALLASQSSAQTQTCTLGPFTSATSLSTINSQINSAPSGAVLCLQRGQAWSASSGLNFTASHPDTSRVTICSSDSTQCTDSGAANARISISGSGGCVAFASGSGGYTVKNLDCYSTNTANAASAWGISRGTHDITIAGGVVDSFWQAGYFDGGNSAVPANNIKMGICGNRLEVRGGPTTNPGGDRHLTWGGLTNSSLTFWVHDFVAFSGSNFNTSHMIDLAENGTLSWNQSSHDVTIECGLYQYNAGTIGTSLHKINRGYNLVIRDNTFQLLSGSDSVAAIAFASHAAGGTEGISGGGVSGAGAKVYRNVFIGGSAIYNEVGADIDVFNNILVLTTSSSTSTGLIREHYEAAASDDVPISDVRLFNNTIYKGSGPSGYPVVSSDNPGTPTRPLPKNNAIFNNLIYDTDSSTANVWGAGQTGCGGFGTNGANIRNNFVYTPNDSTPNLWSGCSGATGNSAAPYNQDPGLSNPAGGSFSLISNSAVAGKGIGAGAPKDDFIKTTRPSPPSVGAYDVAGAGGVAPLEPPVLIQVSTAN